MRRWTAGAKDTNKFATGKSYSMMGYGADRGIIPLICEALFERIESQTTDKLTFTVEVRF